MTWLVEFSSFAQDDLSALDKPIIKQIMKYMLKNIEGCEDPTQFGKPLSGDLAGLHRYRVADYRIVCKLEHNRLVVVAIGISHRKNIYQRIRTNLNKITQ